MNYPYGSINPQSLLEVLDEKDSVLALLDAESVHRQRLRHRVVALAVYDGQKRLLLQRQRDVSDTTPFEPPTSLETPGSHTPPPPSMADTRWALPMASVPAGQSAEDTALYLLNTELGLQGTISVPTDVHNTPLENEFGMRLLLYRAKVSLLPQPMQKHYEYICMDADECRGLALHFSDMLSPWLHTLLQQGLLRM